MSEQEFVSPIEDIKQEIAALAEKDAISPHLVPFIQMMLVNAYTRGWDHGYDKGKEIYKGLYGGSK
jgi:hypothetical protein